MAKVPRYYVTRTLQGGAPDTNRRTIYRRDDSIVAEFNRGRLPWTAEMQAELSVMLAALDRLAPGGVLKRGWEAGP